jgi:hypothetical protein
MTARPAARRLLSRLRAAEAEGRPPPADAALMREFGFARLRQVHDLYAECEAAGLLRTAVSNRCRKVRLLEGALA